MKNVHKAILGSAVVLGVVGFITYLFLSHDLVMLEPRGVIAERQKNLLVFATLLSLFVILPVFIMTIVISLKYREGNKKSKYHPEFDHHRGAETIWWGIPICIILLLSVVTWKSSHDLDPFKPLTSSQKPLTVQVVALQWKWLFIYPEEKIATVNYLKIPTDRPVRFEITSDAPMNSFWIPQLGGQIYAMAGMSTQLHLEAVQAGVYNGASANISGEGFADMNFKVHAVAPGDYETWVRYVQTSPDNLSKERYASLASPAAFKDTADFSVSDTALYDTIIDKYMSYPDTAVTNNHNHDSIETENGATN